MAMLMGPPQLPGYSLRVQLFAPNAHGAGDKPVRCFRVVTSPDVTVRQFCEEASRIHEINYGQTLAIKKCQDDEQFDITQNEILGALFANTATVRIVQATTQPNIRDSVPPTSGLRFDPTNAINRKRQREGSEAQRSSARSSSRKPSKRQRVGNVDPDRPLPSRESDQEGFSNLPDTATIPNSQKSVTLMGDLGHSTVSRDVQSSQLQIPETPSPSPPPSGDTSSGENATAKIGSKAKVSNRNSTLGATVGNTAAPQVGDASRAHANRPKPPRAKSTSYHIQRSTERGASISTAATTPIPGEDKISRNNGTAPNTSRKSLDTESNIGNANDKPGRQPENEDNIYEDIPSDNESAALLALKKAKLKIKRGPASGLPGLEYANGKFKTPPSGNRQSSGSRERLLESPGELQLTPSSKLRDEQKREGSRRQRQEVEEVRKARLAAVERRQEEARIEEERSRREEQENAKADEARRKESQRAAKLQQEREEDEKRQAEETRLREEERKKQKGLKQAKERQEQERIAKEKIEAERLERQRAEEKESERARKEEEARVRQEKMLATISAKKPQVQAEATQANIDSTLRGSSAKSNHLLATKSKSASTSRSRSSTPFIPPGKKSALKSSFSSSQAAAASPSVHSNSPEASFTGVGIEDQMPLPKDKSRRISFADGTKHSSPIKPSATILPPKTRTLQSSPPASTPKTTTPIPPPKPLKITPSSRKPHSPILPPSMNKISKERSITPVSIQKAPTPEGRAERKSPAIHPPARKSQTPIPLPKNITPAPSKIRKQDSDTDSSSEAESEEETPSRPQAAKGSKSVTPPPKQAAQVEVSSDDSEEDVPARVTPSRATENETRAQSKTPAAPIPASNIRQDEDEETASNPSSPRESRSPVIFSQRPPQINRSMSQLSASLLSDNDQEVGGRPGDSADESEATSEDKKGMEDEAESDEDEEITEISEDTSEEDGEISEEDEEESEVTEKVQVEAPKSSPPELPVQKYPVQSSEPHVPNQPKRKGRTSEGGSGTQAEVDQQLTSSMYEVRTSGITSTPPNVQSSAASRPAIKFGASLQSLNSKKPAFGSSSTKKDVRSSQPLHKILSRRSGSEEESEEESDDDSTSSEEDTTTKKSVAYNPRTAPQTKETTKNSDSDGDSDSDSDSDSEDELTRIRKELASRLANVMR